MFALSDVTGLAQGIESALNTGNKRSVSEKGG
jgi:hypothetical protein